MCGSRRHRSEWGTSSTSSARGRVRRIEDPDLRASDADRERVAQLLRDSAADGRLDMDELDERLATAYAARTFGELRGLTRDLPVVAPQPSLPDRPAPVPTTFIWISALLITIWAVTGAGYFWPVWPMLWFCLATVKHRARFRRYTV